MDRAELLSPAGNYECFLAAISAGADAVYLGLDRFGARAYAGNLTPDELNEALDTAHILGRKIYLTVNTLLKDSELTELYGLLEEPYKRGLDGVIVQDIGVISLIRRMFPLLPVHVSTQAAVTASEGALYLKKLGVTRIVPARELSLDEIKIMKSRTGLELECFIHGSMCYSYSGKCLMSSFIGGRSGNRGRCAQPCRLPYDDKYPLSLKDLCTLKFIPALIGAGISSFKIEGRMKSRDYVYAVTSIYRKYIDMYYAGASYDIDEKDMTTLLEGYTRSGNSEGYYFVHNGKDMITPESPSYVSDADNKPASDIKMPSIDVSMDCSIKADSPVSITVSGDRTAYETVTDIIPERSVNRPLTDDGVRKQLSKTGGTCFSVTDIKTDIDEGLFIPNGSLNEIRRQGLYAFKSALLKGYHRSGAENVRIAHHIADDADSADVRTPVVKASVLTADQAIAASDCGADAVIIPMHLFEDSSFKNDGRCDVYVSLPYVIRQDGHKNSADHVEEFIKNAVKEHDIKGFYISNHEETGILRRCSYDGEVIGDVHLYAYNAEAYDLLAADVSNMTVPLELNEHELIKRGITGEELIVYGRMPMMISANCPVSYFRGCRKEESGMHMTDRKGEKLFVHSICSECTSVIYNSAKLSIADEDKLIRTIRPSAVRFSFTDEDPRQVSAVLGTYMSSRTECGSCARPLIDKYTRGHIRRGVG